MKKLIFLGVVALLGASFTACSSHDDSFTIPKVEVAPNTLSGVITDISGDPIEGAVVTVGNETATTNAQGVYHFSSIAAGTHAITVTANGMVPATGEVTIANAANTQNVVWNTTMAKVNVTEVTVTPAAGGTGEVESEALRGNDQGKVDIVIDVPANTVSGNEYIYITPIYTEESAAIRAEEDEMLIGATLSASNPNMTLNNDINLKFELDGSLVSKVETKKFVNGQWVSAPHAVVDGNVVISTREFTSFGIFIKINAQVSRRTTPLTFERSEWDNLDGNRGIYIPEANYTYKVGTEITVNAQNKLEGLLIEWLSRNYGSTVRTVNGVYPLDVNLPVGSALTISGAQEYDNITVSGGGSSVRGVNWGTCNVRVTTFDRNHNGGSSGPIGQ